MKPVVIAKILQESTIDFSSVLPCEERRWGGGEKLRIEENASPIEVVKQLKVTNNSFLFLFIIFTTVSDSN